MCNAVRLCVYGARAPSFCAVVMLQRKAEGITFVKDVPIKVTAEWMYVRYNRKLV